MVRADINTHSRRPPPARFCSRIGPVPFPYQPGSASRTGAAPLLDQPRHAARRPTRAPLPQRSRKRWLAAAIVAACWLALLDLSGSVIAATILLAFLAGLGVVTVLSLRALGLSRDHPWVRRMAARPWRDGQDVLRLALRHLPEVFIVTPSGSLLAPELV